MKILRQMQKNKVLAWFSNHKGTMLECSKSTMIERANICRILWDMREEGLIECVGYRRDSFTGFYAMVFTAKEKGGKL